MKTIYRSTHNDKSLEWLKERGITSSEVADLICDNIIIDAYGNVTLKNDVMHYKGVRFERVSSTDIENQPVKKRKRLTFSGLLLTLILMGLFLNSALFLLSKLI